MRGVGLKSITEWSDYCKSGKKPVDIPYGPAQVYAEDGWSGWGDWLGTERIASQFQQFRSFKKARTFVRGLKLKSQKEWKDYCNSSKKPADIPAAPWGTYADAGWSGMGDWLGTGSRRGGWRNFKDARAFARGLKLKSVTEWFDYCKSGKKPDDIPTSPRHSYANHGWAGFGDWLGTKTVSNQAHREDLSTKPAHLQPSEVKSPADAERVRPIAEQQIEQA